MAPTDDPWVDNLDEDWISQPSTSPVNTFSLPPSDRPRTPSNASSTGTMARHTLDRTVNDEWKHQVMGGATKDLFSPMQLERLFRPPTLGPSSGGQVGANLVLHPTPPKAAGRPGETPRKVSPSLPPSLPPPTRSPRSRLPVRSPEGSPVRGAESPGRKQGRYGNLGAGVGIKGVEYVPAGYKPRGRMILPSGKWQRPPRRGQRVGGQAAVEEEGEETQSPSEESEEERDQEEGDEVGSIKRFPGRRVESSVYPSSPPFTNSHRVGRYHQEDDFDDGYLNSGKDDSDASALGSRKSPGKSPKIGSSGKSPKIGSPGKSPRIGTTPRKSPRLRLSDTPKLQPSMQRRESSGGSSADENQDPFFNPRPPRRRESSTPPGDPPVGLVRRYTEGAPREPPLQLFQSNYDTYTKEMLSKRLEELEQSQASDDGTQSDEEEDDVSERTGSQESIGASAVVSHLEAVARKAERENRISSRHQRRKRATTHPTDDMSPINTPFESRRASPGTRTSSAPLLHHFDDELDSSVRKHRRWHSEEAAEKNDGVSGPMSPLVTPNPKRIRRSLSGGPETLGGQSLESARRPRINKVETDSVLANAAHRSRANTNQSQVTVDRSKAGTPTPESRRKSVESQEAPGSPTSLSRGSPRKGRKSLVFQGRKGKEFGHLEVPNDAQDDDEVRRSSFTTESWLQQAQDVMENLRRQHEGTAFSSEENSPEVTRMMPAGMESQLGGVDITQQSADDPTLASTMKELSLRNGEQRNGDDASGKSSRLSVSSGLSVISNAEELLKHHLAANKNDMVFDEKTRAWVSKTQDPSRDPFADVSDITVDSREEEKARQLINKYALPGSSPSAADRSGMWRSSKYVPPENDQLASSVASSHVTDSAFGEINSRTETRTTSYGGSNDDGKDSAGNDSDGTKSTKSPRKKLELDRSALQAAVETAPPSAVSTGRFEPANLWSSSPVKPDDEIDGFLEHGSLRQKNADKSYPNLSFRGHHRKRSGKLNFMRHGKVIPKIAENAVENVFSSPLHPDIHAELRRLSINSSHMNALTPMRNLSPIHNLLQSSHLQRAWSAPPSNKKPNEVSFHMTPLPELSYFENPEAALALELTYMQQRHGPSASGKALEASMTIAQSNLIEMITDAVDDLYWEQVKNLKLSGRKMETVFSLNEHCPRLHTLDISNNELGQLTGVPESVMDLNVAKNCLSNSTFWGHLMNLQFLDVSGNQLESLQGLRGLRHLRELRADDNLLTGIDGIYGLEGLVKLRCRRNRIEAVDLAKSELTRLVDLDLRGNQITEIYGLECLPSLIHLNLDQNNLTTLHLPPNTQLRTLRSLKLTQNSIQTFDFAPFPSLQICYMDNNRLSHFTHFTTLTRIDAISLRNQTLPAGHLNTLPLSRLLEARKIYLSANTISPQLHSLRIPFLNCQYLELASCQLRALPPNLADIFPNLRVANLNYNQLPDLTPLTGCSRLIKLAAVSNAIKSFPALKHTLEHLPLLRFLDLRSNPLTLAFYPPAVAKRAPRDDPADYDKLPFELPDVDAAGDDAWERRMDLDGRCRRRRYEVLLAICCPGLENVDGRPWVGRGRRGDDVWAEMVRRGWVLEVDEDEDDEEEEEEEQEEEYDEDYDDDDDPERERAYEEYDHADPRQEYYVDGEGHAYAYDD